MSTRERNNTLAALTASTIPSTHNVTKPTIYNVGLGSAPSWKFVYNPGLWKVVDFYINKGFSINSVVYVENEDVNSYRVILTTK